MKILYRPTVLLLAACILSACGSGESPADNSKAATSPEPAASTELPRTASPAGARVFFITPMDGETVPTTFTVEFGVEGMAVVRAGDNAPDSGHHHLLIDTGLPENMGVPIPADANHVHFGDGSSSTERTLAPGEHTLQLLFADHLHIPHSPPVYSERITITVE